MLSKLSTAATSSRNRARGPQARSVLEANPLCLGIRAHSNQMLLQPKIFTVPYLN